MFQLKQHHSRQKGQSLQPYVSPFMENPNTNLNNPYSSSCSYPHVTLQTGSQTTYSHQTFHSTSHNNQMQEEDRSNSSYLSPTSSTSAICSASTSASSSSPPQMSHTVQSGFSYHSHTSHPTIQQLERDQGRKVVELKLKEIPPDTVRSPLSSLSSLPSASPASSTQTSPFMNSSAFASSSSSDSSVSSCSSISVGHPSPLSKAELRLTKDFADLTHRRLIANSDVRITFPEGVRKLDRFDVVIAPRQGLYEKASFLFCFTVPREYPFAAPKVKCLTKCLHPNINWRSGEVYMPILVEWSPVLTLNELIWGLQLLFVDASTPSLDPPAAINREAVELLKAGKEQFELMVQETLHGGFFFGAKWEKNQYEDNEDERECPDSAKEEEQDEKNSAPCELKRKKSGLASSKAFSDLPNSRCTVTNDLHPAKIRMVQLEKDEKKQKLHKECLDGKTVKIVHQRERNAFLPACTSMVEDKKPSSTFAFASLFKQKDFAQQSQQPKRQCNIQTQVPVMKKRTRKEFLESAERKKVKQTSLELSTSSASSPFCSSLAPEDPPRQTVFDGHHKGLYAAPIHRATEDVYQHQQQHLQHCTPVAEKSESESEDDGFYIENSLSIPAVSPQPFQSTASGTHSVCAAPAPAYPVNSFFHSHSVTPFVCSGKVSSNPFSYFNVPSAAVTVTPLPSASTHNSNNFFLEMSD